MTQLAEKLTPNVDEDAKGAELRRSPRDEVALPTRMFTQDQRGCDVLLVNISAHGFMVREYGETPKGTIVRLALPRLGQVSAKVVWSLGGRVGAEFIKPIDSYAYTAMINAAKAKRQRWPMG
ncbi:MAG: PilZ domain-containing protein [Sphingomonadales bacterium]|nr:MAG: PilZ domain-containing protein [Sphingomonadales bacterium]